MNAMRPVITIAAALTLSLVSIGCGDLARNGRAPVFLVIDSLGSAR